MRCVFSPCRVGQGLLPARWPSSEYLLCQGVPVLNGTSLQSTPPPTLLHVCCMCVACVLPCELVEECITLCYSRTLITNGMFLILVSGYVQFLSWVKLSSVLGQVPVVRGRASCYNKAGKEPTSEEHVCSLCCTKQSEWSGLGALLTAGTCKFCPSSVPPDTNLGNRAHDNVWRTCVGITIHFCCMVYNFTME